MKKFLALILAVAALSGCVSQPAGSTASLAPSADVSKIAPFVTQAAQTAVPLVLNKNPQFAPVIATFAAAIPAAFASGQLDATTISSAIATIGNRSGISSEAQSVIAVALLDAVTWYQQAYGQKVASATDPNVVTLLNAFATGLSNGVTVWQKQQPAATP